ncbi:MAG: DUF885 domain-containing protein, partial [Bacteroidota bacterium]
EGIKEKILPPKIIIQNHLKLLKNWIPNSPEEHPFFQPLLSFPTNLSPSQKAELKKRGRTVIRKKIIPTYQKLKKFMANTYLKAAPEKPGVRNIPDGKSFYENRVRFFSTLDISPDSVFQLGQAEVKRIRTSMEKIIQDLNYEGSFADFIQFLRTDPQFYPKSGEALLQKAAWISKQAEAQLPRLFGKLYSLPFTVAPVPDAIAENYTGGRYVPGSRSQNRPGTYWVNTSKLKSRTLYTLPALTLHEAVPGHHLQIMLAAELEGLPDFRNNYYISAYGEGWGLYAEYLGEEMGIYQTPYERFGRYTYEMWRACRLVVDVGLHYKDWSRQEAVDFMSQNTALSLHEVNTEIDRYIGWPGQAISYKIGEITIKYLRKEAEEKLGKAFDIQEFHDIILRNGSVPLPVLEREVSQYIEQKLEN